MRCFPEYDYEVKARGFIDKLGHYVIYVPYILIINCEIMDLEAVERENNS